MNNACAFEPGSIQRVHDSCAKSFDDRLAITIPGLNQAIGLAILQVLAKCREFLLDLLWSHQNVEPANSHNSIEFCSMLPGVQQKSKRVNVEAHQR